MAKKISEVKKGDEVKPEYSEPADLSDHPTLVKGFAALEANAKFQVDMSLMDEIMGLVATAKEVRVTANNLRLPSRWETEKDLTKLAAFFAECQAKRDRAIEIKVEFLPVRRSLERLWEKFLGVIYQYEVLRKLSPAPARDAMINFILAPLREKMSRVELIIEAASEADRNLGNAHFTFKEIKAIGTIFIEGKRAQRNV